MPDSPGCVSHPTTETACTLCLPAAFDGYTITQISDLHLGEWMTLDRMMTVVQEVNALNADAIVITGDFISMLGISRGTYIGDYDLPR